MKVQKKDKFQPFHERHRQVLMICCASGMFSVAFDRAVKPGFIKKLILIWGMFCHFVLIAFLFSNVVHLFLGKSVLPMIHDLLIIGMGVHGAIRQLFMLVNRKAFDKLWTSWDDLFGHDEDADERRVFVKKNVDKIRNKLVRLGVFSTVSLGICIGINYLDPHKEVKIPTALPYRHQSPDFEIVLTAQSFSAYLFNVAVTSSQYVLALPMVWSTSELQRLRISLATLLKEAESLPKENGQYKASYYTQNGLKKIHRKLNVWVNNHRKVLEFHRKSVELMDVEFSLEMVASFVEAVACACVLTGNYLTLEEKITGLAAFGTYNRFFYHTCICASELITESQTVFDDAFEQNWTALPTEMKKDLYIILMRTMKPLAYFGTKIFRLDLESYNKILQTAYSVFSFAATMITKT